MKATLRILVAAMAAIWFAPIMLAEDQKSETSDVPTAAAGILFAPLSKANARDMKAWKISLVPLAASQVLDINSGWGRRELNPLLASSDGSFGMKGATIKIGLTAAMVGVEYVLIKKYPKTARIFSTVNWSGAAVTSSFAAHNYLIR